MTRSSITAATECQARSSLGAAGLAFLAALAAAPTDAQQPILEVRLEGVAEVLVQGRLTAGGTLELPVRPIEELTGARLGDVAFLSLDGLRHAFGSQVTVDYQPRLALLLIRDPTRSLPASAARLQRLTAEARARPEHAFARGPFGAVTADSEGDRLVEAGWNFGWLAFNVAESTLSGTRLGLVVRPLPRVWVSYDDGERRGGTLAARWAGGRTFARAAYTTDDEEIRGQVGTSAGPFTVFVQRDPDAWSGALSLRGPVHVTVSHADERFATRVSFGRMASPFMFPRVR